jgi:hypothetical protein
MIIIFREVINTIILLYLFIQSICLFSSSLFPYIPCYQSFKQMLAAFTDFITN